MLQSSPQRTAGMLRTHCMMTVRHHRRLFCHMFLPVIQVGEVPKPDHSMAAGQAHAFAWHDPKTEDGMPVAQRELTHQSLRPPSFFAFACQVGRDPGLQRMIAALGPTQPLCSTFSAVLSSSMEGGDPLRG